MDHMRRYREIEQRLFEDAGVTAAERYVRLASIGSEARVLEIGSGAPLLFLTGGPNAAATWAYVAAELANEFRCVLLDRPGTGLSEPPPFRIDATNLAGYSVRLVTDTLDALALGGVPVVGSSLGGSIALRAALADPTSVSAVLLAGYPAFTPGWRQPAFFDVLRAPVLGRVVLRLPATRASARMSLRQMGHRRALETGRVPGPMLDWVHAWQRDTGTMRNDARVIIASGRWRRGFDPALDLTPDDLRRIDVPTTLVCGTDDVVGGEAEARALGGLIPGASVDIWDEAGHLPWLDDPRRMATAIASLAARARSAGDHRQVTGGR